MPRVLNGEKLDGFTGDTQPQEEVERCPHCGTTLESLLDVVNRDGNLCCINCGEEVTVPLDQEGWSPEPEEEDDDYGDPDEADDMTPDEWDEYLEEFDDGDDD